MLCVLLVAIWLEVGVAPPSGGPAPAPAPVDSGTTTSSTCNVDVGDDSTYTETIETASDANNGFVRHIEASGCPNYPTAPLNPNDAAPQDKDYEIMAYPCFSNMSEYNLTCTGGPVGITLNGISIFSLFPGTCGQDAVELEGFTFDSCSGHSDEDGEYHYHITPACLLDQMGDYYDVTEHSPLIGWAFDGFPVYGPHGPGGDLIYPCNHSLANASSCLDDCGGTEQYIIDGFLYHYHMVGPIGDLVSSPVDPLPNTSMVPYTIGCFKGVVYDWSIVAGSDNGASCASNGYDDSYTASATEGVTAIYGSTTTGSPTGPLAEDQTQKAAIPMDPYVEPYMSPYAEPYAEPYTVTLGAQDLIVIALVIMLLMNLVFLVYRCCKAKVIKVAKMGGKVHVYQGVRRPINNASDIEVEDAV